ncbi:MAG: hypothetical protein AB7J35_19875 [Dehalococcoidia bacterium]
MIGIGRFRLSHGWFGLKGIAVAILALGFVAGFVDGSLRVVVGTSVAAVALFVISFWGDKWVVEFREFAVLLDSDLSELDERKGPRLVDYDWIEDMRWDEQDRLVLKIHEDASLFIPARFTRTPIPMEFRREVSRILRERSGKSRAEIESEQSAKSGSGQG